MTLEFSPAGLIDQQMNFDDGWTPLTAAEAAEIWPTLTQCLGPRAGQPDRVKVGEQPLSFLPGGKIIRLRQRRGLGQATRYLVLLADGTGFPIRYSTQIIDRLHEHNALRFDADNIGDYLTFYWRFTSHGRAARLLDPDLPLSVSNNKDGMAVMGEWHEHGQAFELHALIGHDGHVRFAEDTPSMRGGSAPRLQ